MWRKILFLVIMFGFGLSTSDYAAIQIIQIKGEAKIRRGLEEGWQQAGVGMLLENLDTILTLEGAEVLLKIDPNVTFRLGSNAVLDLADLRRITERELFLYLMQQKMNGIEPRKEKIPLRVPNVSVLHGGLQSASSALVNQPDTTWWVKEFNGAQALYSQAYFPNTVVTLHKILQRYPKVNDCGQIHFCLGQALEALEKTGQALDAYQAALQRSQNTNCQDEKTQARQELVQNAMGRLKKKN